MIYGREKAKKVLPPSFSVNDKEKDSRVVFEFFTFENDSVLLCYQ